MFPSLLKVEIELFSGIQTLTNMGVRDKTDTELIFLFLRGFSCRHTGTIRVPKVK